MSARHDRKGLLIDLTFVAVPVAILFNLKIAGVAESVPFAPVVLVSAILLHGVVKSLRRARRARLRADSYRAETGAEAEGSRPLQAGDVVISGRVAYAQDAAEAMRVDLVQEGSESESSGVWSHAWTEVSRKLTVNPFYLVHDPQTRIRVEPDTSSQLFDDFEGKILVLVSEPHPLRERVATLVPDEHVWVVGRLGREYDPEAHGTRAASYRDTASPEGWVLRGAPTLLVSSVPLVEHFRGRAAMHRRHALLLAICLIFPAALFARRIDRIEGHTVTGVVDSVSSSTDSDTGGITCSTHVNARGERWEAETSSCAWDVGSPYELRLGTWTSNDGDDVHWTSGEFVAALILLASSIVLRLALRSRGLRTLPWYRSARPYVEGGKGRLQQEA